MLRLLDARWRLSDSPGLHLMPMPSDALAVVLMPGLLHPTVKRPDARWRLSIDEVARVASDADAIRCTGGCLDARLRCIRPHRDQMKGS